jgi:DNA-binding NarL/FixJ family response regulator
MKVIRVVVVDDHRIVRRAIRTLLEREPGIKVVSEAADGQVLVAVTQHHPDVLVLDVRAPGPTGLNIARRVRARRPDTGIVMLCMHPHDGPVGEALRIGVDGYVVKSAAPRDLFKAVHAAAARRRYLALRAPPGWAASAVRVAELPAELTPRERQVRLLLAWGSDNSDIAAQLGIRQRTVQTHRMNLMRKLGIHSQGALVRQAVEEGLIGPGDHAAPSRPRRRRSTQTTDVGISTDTARRRTFDPM